MNLITVSREAHVLTQLEDASKTKIRGIFCLLKNSHAIITSGNDQESSVRLYLGKGIITFRQFRERQDSFITRCLTLQKIFMPFEKKGEVIWQLNEETLVLRLEELRYLERPLEEFFVKEISRMNLLPAQESSFLHQPAAGRNHSSHIYSNGFSLPSFSQPSSQYHKYY
jgi:hypothetical protein